MSSDECEFRGRGKRRDKDDSSSTSSVSSEEEFVDCPCGMTDVEKRFMLECPSCRMWQHANCVNVWDPFSPILDSYARARCVKSEALIYKVRVCVAAVPFAVTSVREKDRHSRAWVGPWPMGTARSARQAS